MHCPSDACFDAIAALCHQHGGQYTLNVPIHILERSGELVLSTRDDDVGGVRLTFTYVPNEKMN